MKRFMRFFSPDEGGGAGVDAPPAPGPSTGVKKMGDAFRESMAQNSPEYKEEVDQNAASKARKAAAAAAKAPADPPPAPAKEEKKEEAAPTEDKKEKAKKGALDAATDIAAPPAATGDEPAEADPLKDLPEKLPTEGKGDHWEKARGTISSQHKAIGELGTQVKALQKQLDESKSGPPDLQKKLEEVTNELNQYRDAMVELNVEYDPGFRNKYIKGRTSLVEKAAGKVKAYGGDPAAFADAMGMREGRSRNEAIKQALTEMDEGDRVRIQTLVTDIEKLDDEANEQRANSQQSWEKLQQQRKVEAEQKKTESEQFKRTIFDKVLTSLGLTVLPLREVPTDGSIEGATEWNARREEIRNNAFKLAEPGVKPEEYALAAMWRYAGPVVQQLLNETRAQLKATLEKVNGLEAAEPSFRGGAQPKKVEAKALGDKYRDALKAEQGE